MPTLKPVTKNTLCILFVLAVALILRFYQLELRPIHLDEGVNGWRVDQLMPSLGYYPYDPGKFHGPLHFYILSLFKNLFGHHLWALRLPSVLFGSAVVVLPLFFRKIMKLNSALLFSAFLSVSAGMVFYSRDAIHETGFLFFTMSAVFGSFLLVKDNSKLGLWVTTLGVSGMVLEKETWILHISALLASLYFIKPKSIRSLGYGWISPFAILIFLVTLFYSGFFHDFSGLSNFFSGFWLWGKQTAAKPIFIKPVYFWLKLMAIDEPICLVGIVVALKSLMSRSEPSFKRFFSVYGLMVLSVYSLIPYKTPWCAIGIIWPFQLLAAIFICEVGKTSAIRYSTWAIALLVMIFSIRQSAMLNFVNYDCIGEPYLFNQMSRTTSQLAAVVLDAAREKPLLYTKPIGLYITTPWPLPWVFENFSKVNLDAKMSNQKVDGLFLLSNGANREMLERRLTHSYYVKTLEMDQMQGSVYAYFDATEFSGHLSQLEDASLFIPFH